MPDLFTGLDPWVAASLVLALTFVLAFEFINGFHDTANAVATVIYTKAMPPYLAVVASGIFNFLGVLLGGVGVAYAIVHLLPVELLVNVDTGRGLAMVFAMLSAAIIWNLATWYVGLPASSSHTLIGSILGVGLANALMTDLPLGSGVNWGKAMDIGLSLIMSPIAGFLAAGGLFLLLRRYLPLSKMHKTPEQRRETENKKHPPFWNRVALIFSAMAVSFVHGSNDGQKGIGLVMLVLIGIVPANYVLNIESTPYQIQRTQDAAAHLSTFYLRNGELLNGYLGQSANTLADPDTPQHFRCEASQTMQTLEALQQALHGATSYTELSPDERIRVRRYLLCLDDTAKKVSQDSSLPAAERNDLNRLRSDLTATTEYAPLWVIVAIALALGAGTMIGWRRVVLTVGEKIGRQGMTYAQGMSAQVTAACAIGVANVFSLPVSTTHVLSSGVAGTMVANKSGLQTSTIRSILLAWAMTLPISIGLAALFFWIGVQFTG